MMIRLSRDLRLAYLSGLAWGFGLSLFFFIQPLYIARLGAAPEQIGLTLGMSGLIGVFLYIPMGFWADRLGRKPVMIAGWSMGTLATLAMALAADWRWFIPGLTAYQLSIFALPAFYGYIAAKNTDDNPNRTFATIASSVAVGSIISPAVGGWIGEQFGLRAVYFFAAVIFGLSTLAIASVHDQPVAPSTPKTSPKQLLTNRPFIWQIVFVFLVFFAIDLGQVLVPKFLEDVYDFSVGQIGWLGTVGSLGIVILTLLLGQLPAERRGAILLGQLVALAALLLWLSSPSVAIIALAYFIHGSNRVIRPLIDGRLSYTLDSTTLSLGYGFRETAMRLGLTVSPYIAGLLYAYNPTWPLYGGVLALSLTLLISLTLPTNIRTQVQYSLKT